MLTHSFRCSPSQSRQAIDQVAGFVHPFVLGPPGAEKQPCQSADEDGGGDEERKNVGVHKACS